MFEGSAKEITEDDFKAALRFGQECCQSLIQVQRDLVSKAGRPKREITLSKVPDDFLRKQRNWQVTAWCPRC